MADLIDREAARKKLLGEAVAKYPCSFYVGLSAAAAELDKLPAVDAVEVATLESWLHKIAMNNIGAPVADMAEACEIIISRLGGLRRFAEERRVENE